MSLSVDSSHDEFLQYTDELLIKGIKESNHPFHQFVFASTENDIIQQRTVVLRRWVLKRRSIIFHTDYRSPKVKQIKKNPDCSILFYSKPDKLQLRFKCFSHIHHNDRLSKYIYSQTTPNQRKCYETPYIPSTKMNNTIAESTTSSPEDNFSVCVCNFNELEILFLNHQKHIRILYEWDKSGHLKISNLNP